MFTLLHEAKDANGNLIPTSHKKPTYSPNSGMVDIDVDGHSVASASLVGRSVIIVNMDAASDTLIVWVMGVRSGDLTLPDDLSVLADSLYGMVQGDIWVDDTALTDLDALATVWEVQGDVYIRYNPSLTDVSGLVNIKEIGGDLIFDDNATLATPNGLPTAELKHVGGSFRILSNPQITKADVFGNLEAVDGELEINNNPSLTDVSGFSSLTWADELTVTHNETLSIPGGFPALRWIGSGGMYVYDGATVVTFPALESVSGVIMFDGGGEGSNPVEAIHMPQLTCVGYNVWVYDNPSLTTLDLPALDRVGAECSGPGAPARSTASKDHLSSASASTSYGGDPRGRAERNQRIAKRAAEMTAAIQNRHSQRTLERAQRSQASRKDGPPVAKTQAPRPSQRPAQASRVQRSVSGPARAGCECPSGVLIENNDYLTDLDLSALRDVDGDIYLRWLDIPTLDLPSLEYVSSDISLSELNSLTSVSASLLEEVDGFYLHATNGLEALDLSSLMWMRDFDLWNDVDWDVEAQPVSAPQRTAGPTLWSLDLPSLQEVNGYFYVSGLVNLQSFSADALEYIDEVLVIEYLDALEDFSFHNLEWVYCDEGCVDIQENPSLTWFDLAKMFTYEFHLGYNNALATLPDLGGMAGDGESFGTVRIQGNNLLTSLDGLAGVEELYQLYLHYTSLTDLSALNTPGSPLSRLKGLEVIGNDDLTSLDGFAGLTGNMIYVNVTSNAVLVDVTGLANLGTDESANPVVSGNFMFSFNTLLCSEDVDALFATIEAANPADPAAALPGKSNSGHSGCY